MIVYSKIIVGGYILIIIETLFQKYVTMILFCIVMPRIASSTASASIVSPGKLETDFAVIAELRKLGDGHNANDPAFSQLKASLLRQYSVQTVEELPINEHANLHLPTPSPVLPQPIRRVPSRTPIFRHP